MTSRLLIRPGAIGDCILSLPALEFLQAGYTEVWISSPVVPLIQFADKVRPIASTGLDLVLDCVPPEMARKLGRFEEIVSWYGANRLEFRNAMNAIHPRCTFLQALPEKSWCEHAGDFFLQQVGAPNGLLPKIAVTAGERRRSVVIHPFSGSASKNWPLEKFKVLARHLPAVEWAQTGFDNLLELACWMKGASVYVGNDSGISHLAAAIGLNSVVLFGPTDPAVWAPRGECIRVIRHRPLAELSVETVVELVGS